MKSPKFAAKLASAIATWYETVRHDMGQKANDVANAHMIYAASPDLPKVVCLCGSTRFKEAFVAANRQETLNGNIVLSVGFFGHEEGFDQLSVVKQGLDDLHKRKIDLADEVLILNVGGYVGPSTRSEVEYARANGKDVRWLNMSDDVKAGEAVDNVGTTVADAPPA